MKSKAVVQTPTMDCSDVGEVVRRQERQDTSTLVQICPISKNMLRKSAASAGSLLQPRVLVLNNVTRL